MRKVSKWGEIEVSELCEVEVSELFEIEVSEGVVVVLYACD